MHPRWKRRIRIAALALAFFGALALAARPALGLRDVDPVLGPDPSPQGSPDDALLAGVLRDHVHEGRVDYTGLARRPERLEAYARELASLPPEEPPEWPGPTPWVWLAYRINAYNALALLGVVRAWPIRSVHEVRGWLEPREGFGFFYALRFMLNRERINLYELEGVIRESGDPRVHAALNCASASCPSLRGEPYGGDPERLEAQLEEAAEAFASDPPHVEVDESGRRIRLSMIYAWHEEDFGGDRGEEGVLDYLIEHARPEVAAALRSARERHFRVEHVPYDWRLNGR